MYYELYADSTAPVTAPTVVSTPVKPVTTQSTTTPTQPTQHDVVVGPTVSSANNPIGKATSIGFGIWLAVLIFMLIWGIAGFVAFVMSIVCFTRSGTIGQQIGGLLIAVFLGPLYWFYYGLSKSYCSRGMVGGKKR